MSKVNNSPSSISTFITKAGVEEKYINRYYPDKEEEKRVYEELYEKERGESK